MSHLPISLWTNKNHHIYLIIPYNVGEYRQLYIFSFVLFRTNEPPQRRKERAQSKVELAGISPYGSSCPEL